MALAGVAGAAGGLVLGRHIDAGHGRRAMLAAYAVTAVVLTLRALSLDWPALAVLANALGALVGALLIPALMTPVYNLAKASPCPLRFHIVTEAGWDIGCFCGCLLAAGLAALGVSLGWAILVALPGLFCAVALLWRYYGKDGETLASAEAA
jgi:DHA1 family inner membrane transport protein